MQQVPVGSVDLHEVESRFEGAQRRRTKGLYDVRDLCRFEGPRGRPPFAGGQRAGTHGLPRRLTLGRKWTASMPRPRSARLPARVIQLDARRHPMRSVRVRDPPKGRNLIVLPDAGAPGRNTAVAGHPGGLYHGRPHPAQREPGVVSEVPVLWSALDSLVLAHRRDHDAVAERQASDRQRRKEHRLRHGRAQAWPAPTAATSDAASRSDAPSSSSISASSSSMNFTSSSRRFSPSSPSCSNVVNGGRTSPTGNPAAAASSLE